MKNISLSFMLSVKKKCKHWPALKGGENIFYFIG